MSTTPLIITLPYGPSTNTYWNIFRNRFIVSREGRAYKKVVHEIARKSGVDPFTGDVDVRIDLYRPQASGDIDGRLKPVLDVLAADKKAGFPGFAYINDKQIPHLDVYRHDDPVNPRVQIQVTPLDGPGLFGASESGTQYREALEWSGVAEVEIAAGRTANAVTALQRVRAALLHFPGVMMAGGVVEARKQPHGALPGRPRRVGT